jgi:hypothetical protein
MDVISAARADGRYPSFLPHRRASHVPNQEREITKRMSQSISGLSPITPKRCEMRILAHADSA